MRIAWFSPLPPMHSGIAAYSLDVLAGLAGTHEVQLFADDEVWRAHGGQFHASAGDRIAPLRGPIDLPLHRAYDFPVLHARQAYGLIVYQLGNATCHRYMWPYLLEWPGLVVLHDAALHHARAQALLRDKRADDYRAEFRFNHPGVDPRVADFVVAGLQGSPYYLWPMLRTVMIRARAVAVHAEPIRSMLAEEFPETPITTIAMGVPDPWQDPGTGHRAPGTGSNAERRTPNAETDGRGASPGRPPRASQRAMPTFEEAEDNRSTHDLRPRAGLVVGDGPPNADGRMPTAGGVLVLSAFGLITPEKRILPILRALAELRAELPPLQLRLVGEIGEHYALWEDIRRTGTRDLVEVTGYVDDDQLGAELRAADVCLCLRWPTAHETSASWLRCLAAGKPTIVPDQLTTVEVPTLDPRHWLLKHRRDDSASVFQPPNPAVAVAVSIELGDEAAMLRQALRRLVADAELRASLGARAREWWQAHHTVERMHRDYQRVMIWAATLPDPEWPQDAPPHLRPDPRAFARTLAARFGVDVDILG